MYLDHFCTFGSFFCIHFLRETRISLPGYSTLNGGNPNTCTVFSDDHFSAVCAAAAMPVIHIRIETLSLLSRGGSLDVLLSSERRGDSRTENPFT